MSDDAKARVRMVTTRDDGRYNLIETRPMDRSAADRIAAEAVGLGIPASVITSAH